jgi:hypothetical protein
MAAGDHAGAAEEFVETVALGSGAWAQLPPHSQRIFIENAPTFLDEANDPEQITFELERMVPFSKLALLTTGDLSSPAFAPAMSKIAGALRTVEVHPCVGARHIPHVIHPDIYIELLTEFIRRHSS